MVETLIEQVEQWLAANRPDYFASFQPGLTNASLDAFESLFTLKLPESFRAFYRWRNGTTFYHNLQSNWCFMPLERVIENKQMLDGMMDQMVAEIDDPNWWQRGWVPYLEDCGGDFICVDVTAEGGGVPGQIRLFCHDDGPRDVLFPSFEEWLRDLLHSMENGTLDLI